MSRIARIMVVGSVLASGVVAQDRPDRDGEDRLAQAETESPRAMLDQSVIDGCLMCHRGELSLAEREAGEVAAAIASIRAGEVDHLVPVPELSDAERAVLAEALVAAEQGP